MLGVSTSYADVFLLSFERFWTFHENIPSIDPYFLTICKLVKMIHYIVQWFLYPKMMIEKRHEHVSSLTLGIIFLGGVRILLFYLFDSCQNLSTGNFNQVNFARVRWQGDLRGCFPGQRKKSRVDGWAWDMFDIKHVIRWLFTKDLMEIKLFSRVECF